MIYIEMVCVNRLFLLCGICIAIHVVIEVVSVFFLFCISTCIEAFGRICITIDIEVVSIFFFLFCISTCIEALGMICITIDIEVASIFFLLLHFELLQV